MQLKNVLVCGAGIMGQGIASVSAAAGYNVTLYDKSKEALTASRDKIAKILHKSNAFSSATTAADLSQIVSFANLLEPAASGADLIIEAIAEDEAEKKALFAVVDAHAPKSCLITTNTSSLSVTGLGSSLCRPDKFAGLHFFNPVPAMKLVEVVPSKSTSAIVVDALKEFVKSLDGKVPVVVPDSPGFVVNRLLVPYLMGSLSLYRQHCSKDRNNSPILINAEEIDTAMKLGAGMPIGPFSLMDRIGLDTLLNIARSSGIPGIEKSVREDSLSVLREFVEAGKLGRKPGSGFYEYPNNNKL